MRLRAGTQSRCESDCDGNDVQIKFTVFKFVSMLINLPKMNHSYHGIKRTMIGHLCYNVSTLSV